MKDKLGDLLIQIISVMIGVFLGFLISDWSEANKDDAKTEVLKTSIENEINNNKSKIGNVLNYHRTVRDSARYYLNQPFTKSKAISFFRGVNTVVLNNSAFDTGVQTGLITNIPVEKIQALNEIYSRQKSYQDFSNLLISGLITLDFDQNEKSMKKILMYLSISMTDIVIKEEQLLRSYDDFMKMN